MADRIYLFGRRLAVTAQFRVEHRWSWWACWQMSRVHQRHMLRILAELRADREFEREVEAWIAALPVVGEAA